MRFVVASANKGKIQEIKKVLEGTSLEVISMAEAGFNDEIDETGVTFEENAMIKAETIARKVDAIVMADDSGLEVDALNGAPGVYSARYAGPGATDMDRVIKLLGELSEVPDEKRQGRFVSAIAVVLPDGRSFIVRGTCEGIIAREPSGSNGFGYDPIFYMPEFNCTMAELSIEEKNQISHRGRALVKMVEKLRELGI
jgi:XTP/dITP diphosphohydrolase